MADLLSIGISGLLAHRQALNTTSHNIANVNTEGYSRQRVEFDTRTPEGSGAGFVGTGVDITTVRRIVDELNTTRLQADASAYQRLDVFADFASRVDQLLSDADAGLSQPLQGFFDAASDLAQNPTSEAARANLIGTADTLASRFGELQAQLDVMDDEINQRIGMTVDDINRYTESIAKLNDEIALQQGQFGGQPANDLLDQRDQLVRELAGQIGIKTTTQSDGTLSVFTATGQALVLGKQNMELSVGEDAYGSGRVDIIYGGNSRITDQVSGGALGGLLDVRREAIDPARSRLGRLAVGIGEAFNAQHMAGMDSYGDLGGEFFSVPSGTALAAVDNSGSATIDVGFGNVSALTGDDYDLSFDGTAWSLNNRSTGTSVALSGSGTAADPLRADGFELVVSGAASAGDRFLIQPTAHAASDLSVAITDPARVAAASPLRAEADLGNTGSAKLSQPTVTDASNPDLQTPVTISFTGANSYQINGSGSYTWSAGTPISVNGWQMSITGTPAAGDQFSVGPGTVDSGDNGNARALAQLGQQSLFDGGRSSIKQEQAGLVSQAGLNAQQSALRRDAQGAVQAQNLARRESVSGVNLDEEAADLVRYQQAYQAAAQVIQVANELFQTLLSATR